MVLTVGISWLKYQVSVARLYMCPTNRALVLGTANMAFATNWPLLLRKSVNSTCTLGYVHVCCSSNHA